MVKKAITKRELVLQVEELRSRLAQAEATLHATQSGEVTAAAEALKASEGRFRVLTETTSAAIFITEGLRILYANNAAQLVTGYSCDELLSMELWQVAHADYREILKRHGLAQPWAANIPSRFELKISTRDGQERWLDVTSGDIEYEGRPASVVTAFDITERDRAEKELRKAHDEMEARVRERTAQLTQANADLQTANEELQVTEEELRQQNEELVAARYTVEAERQRYLDLFDFAPDGYVVTDLQGVIRQANRSAMAQLHVSQSSLVGKLLSVFVAKEDLRAFYICLSQLHDVGGVQRWEGRLQPRGSAAFHAAITATVVYDPQGKPDGLRWLIRDITEHKKVEAALRESESRFRLALKHAPVTVAAQDRDLRFIWAYNQRTVRPADAIGKTDADLFAPEDAARLVALKRKVLETGADVREQFWLTRPGGRMFLDVYLEPMRDDAGQIIGVGIATVDLTERKRAEEEIASVAKFPSENPNPVLRLSQAGVVLYANEACKSLLWEWNWSIGDAVPAFWRDLIAEAVASRSNRTLDVECGERIYSFFITPIPEAGYVNLYGIDITERKRADEALHRLNRTLRAHSHSDQALIRATHEAEYMQEVCKIIVEDCGHAMVWVGFAEDDQVKSVRPVAHAGFEEGYLETLHITWADTERGRGPTGAAIRTGKPSFCRNMLTDPSFAPWRAEALKRRYAASLVLPLLDQGRAFGALTIYFREPDPFTEDEIRLLSGLADDLAYGIQTLRLRAAHAQAEEALRQSEKRYHSLFEGMTEGFALHEIICDQRGQPCDYRFLEVNPAFERLTSLRREDVVGRTHNEVLPDDSPGWVKAYGDVALTGNPIQFENYSLALKRHYQVFAYRPAPHQFAVIFMDITERKQAELALRDSEERFKAIAETTPVGIGVVGVPEGNFLFVNTAYEKAFGYAKGELLGRRTPEIYWETADQARILHILAESGNVADYEVKLKRKDGTPFWGMASARPISYGGRPALLGTFVDISERKRAEEERERLLAQLDAEKARWQATVESMLDPVTVCDAQGRATFMNQAYSRMVERAIQPDLDLDEHSEFYQLYHADGTLFPPDELPLQKAALTGEPVRNVEIIQRDPMGGAHRAIWNAAPLLDAQGHVTGAVAVGRDVTEQRQAEAEQAWLLEENRRQRQFLERLMQVAPIGIAVVRGPDHVYEFVNPYYQMIPGLPDVPIVGRSFAEVFPDISQVGLDMFETVYRTGRTASVREYEAAIGPEPSHTFWDVDAVPLDDAEGKVDRVLILAREATDQVLARNQVEAARRTAEAAAQEAQRRAAELDAMIAAIPDGILIIDRDGMILRMNPAVEKSMGASEAVRAMPLAERLAHLQLETAGGVPLSRLDDTPVRRALRGEVVHGAVLSMRAPDGRRQWLSTSAAPVQTADGRTLGAVISLADITELRQTQQRLEESNEKLQRQTEELQVLAEELIQARDELELRVQERTQELASSNHELERASEQLRERNDELFAAHQMVETERQRYHDLFEFAPDGYLMTSPDGVIQEANHAVAKLLDFSHDYLVGKPLDTFVAEQNQPAFGALLAWSQREFETGSSNWELRLQPRRRASFDAELTFAPVRDAQRELVGLRWLVRDISGRKQAEAALRLASAYNRSLIEASLDPLVTIGPDGKITDVNLATEAATGRSRADLVGTDFSEYFTDPDLARAGYQAAFRAGAVRDYALELLHRDGSVTSVLYNASVYRDEAGQVMGVFAAARDITVQKQAEERLRLQSAALEAAANGILIADWQGNIQWINPAFTQMTGYAANEALGQNPRLVRSGHHTPEFYRQLWDTILAGQVWRGEMTNKRKDGSLYIEEQTIAPVRNEQGELAHFVAIKQDVTQRKRAEDAERDQRQLAEGLVQATLALNSSLDLGEVLDRILEQIQRVIPYHAADITLLEGETVRVARHRGFEQLPAAKETLVADYSLGAFPLFKAMSTTGQPVLVADTRGHSDWRVVPGFEWARSYVGAPLTVGEQVTGFINILGEQPGSFDEGAIERLRAFATHAALAIQNARSYQAELHARHIAETLSAANLALTQTLELEAVMKTLLDHMSQLVPYDSANVMLLESESRLVVKVIRGYERWTDPAQTRAIAFDTQTNPLLQALLSTQKSILIPDTRLHPGWDSRPGAEHVRSWLGVPLAAGGQVIGVYSLDKVEPNFFTPEHIRLAEALVGQAAVAIQNAWLFDQIRAGRERLQSLSRRLVEVQEAERRYVARELHDEVGQALTSLMFGLGQLEPPADPSVQSTRIAELKQMTNAISESLHQLAMDLRPASLDHLGLVPALQQYVKMVGDRYGLIAQFKALGVDGVRLLPAMETALYRIVQEALTNVVRHARATRVDVLLERRGDKVIIVIEDDGIGFDADTASFAQSGRLGLLGMQERAEMLGGSLVVESSAGAGATMVVEVPYANSYPHR